MGTYNFSNDEILSIGGSFEPDEELEEWGINEEEKLMREKLEKFIEAYHDFMDNQFFILETAYHGENIIEIKSGYYEGFQTQTDPSVITETLWNRPDKVKERYTTFLYYAQARYAKENGFYECYGSWVGHQCEIDENKIKELETSHKNRMFFKRWYNEILKIMERNENGFKRAS